MEKPTSTTQSSTPSPAMVRIDPGSFMMAGPLDNETPVQNVQFTKPFAIARYETTFDEYYRFAQATGRPLPNDEGWGRGSRPAINVSWEDAKAYAEWLSRATRQGYRLPTESEWEYAARSGARQEIWAGTSEKSQLKEFAIFFQNSGSRTAEVGSKRPNGFGLYDMSGNVYEWVEDCGHDNYNGAPVDGSAWLNSAGSDCTRRVLRGGSLFIASDEMRASHRLWNLTVTQASDLGFRLVQDIEP